MIGWLSMWRFLDEYLVYWTFNLRLNPKHLVPPSREIRENWIWLLHVYTPLSYICTCVDCVPPLPNLKHIMWGLIPLQPTTPARALTKQPFIGTYIRVDYMHKVITSPVGKEYLSAHKREAFYSVWAAWFFCNLIAMFIMLMSCLHPRQSGVGPRV